MDTSNRPGGLAIVGDGGKQEYVQHPDGSGFVTRDKPTFIDLLKYSKVFPELKASPMQGNFNWIKTIVDIQY